MPRILIRLLVLCSLGSFAVPTLAAQEPPKELSARLRVIEKEIAAVRGLAFKKPVEARVIARPDNVAKNGSIQGHYDIKAKILFVNTDTKDGYKNPALIHEMFHALQDQHFDLARMKARLHVEKYDNDADLALAALIEGDASYTTIEVLKKELPNFVALEDAANPLNAFLNGQGVRYVKALKERGGWDSVNRAYKFPPQNTASIFHLRSVSSIDLGPGPSRGAFGVFKMLCNTGLAGLHEQAAPAARAWRGDRTIELKTAKAWIVACDTRDTAALLHTAFSTLLAARPRLGGDKSRQGVITRGRRVYLLEAADDAAYHDMVDRLEGPLDLSVYSTKDKKTLSFGDLIDRLLDADLVCIGESHDADLHHLVQHQIIKGLFARDERLGVGLEMFQQPFQKELDRYGRGECSEEEFLKASEYQKRWGYDWSLYQPIVDFCRHNRIPLAALNAPKELTGQISKVGHAGLKDEEKKQLGNIDFHLKEHRDYWYERLAKLHGGSTKKTPEEKERSYQVMTVWDDFMAQSAAHFQKERRLRRLVILAGSGHIDRGFGIPLRAARRTGGKALTVKIEYGPQPSADTVTDFVVLVR